MPELCPERTTLATAAFYPKVDHAVVSLLSKAGWTWGCVATLDAHGRTIFVADAHRGDGKRYVVHADEKLSAFVELERITHELAVSVLLGDDSN